MTITYPLDYDEILKEYNKQVSDLAEKRRLFYEQNPDFPYSTMYMNVIPPPQKLVITWED